MLGSLIYDDKRHLFTAVDTLCLLVLPLTLYPQLDLCYLFLVILKEHFEDRLLLTRSKVDLFVEAINSF